jgi:phage shock protein A
VKIQNQLEGLSVDAEVRALDNVREHIKNTVAQAKMGQELRDSDLDVQAGASCARAAARSPPASSSTS